MTFFKHPQALVESEAIGAGTRIWAFAHVLPGAVIGQDCNICDHSAEAMLLVLASDAYDDSFLSLVKSSR